MSFNRMISITDIEKRRRNGGQNGNGNGVLTETSDTGRIEGRISGVIANEMAQALKAMGKTLYAVGNRTHEKAVTFAEK